MEIAGEVAEQFDGWDTIENDYARVSVLGVREAE